MENIRSERLRLVKEVEEYEELLKGKSLDSEVIQRSIEELRAIRMRIHEIDSQIRESKLED